ncbi:MAG: YicC/YloC family endoribonuclease [Bacteroidota bacterium]
MISSMTGYGHGEAGGEGITAIAEVRSVNSRYFEVNTRLPRSLSLRENDVREIVRAKAGRGKINVVVSIERESGDAIPLKINKSAAKSYIKLLNDLRKTSGIKEKVTLDHLLKFSEVIEAGELESADEKEWAVAEKALGGALDELRLMRQKEGNELRKDLESRIQSLEGKIKLVEGLSKESIPEQRDRLRERVQQLLTNGTLDENRLELEIAFLADKLDVTEECVRFRSHNKFFLEALINDESAGRKLNFLVQEMNREANTVGSKAANATIAHHVVEIKEELEKIREQLQNVE